MKSCCLLLSVFGLLVSSEVHIHLSVADPDLDNVILVTARPLYSSPPAEEDRGLQLKVPEVCGDQYCAGGQCCDRPRLQCVGRGGLRYPDGDCCRQCKDYKCCPRGERGLCKDLF